MSKFLIYLYLIILTIFMVLLFLTNYIINDNKINLYSFGAVIIFSILSLLLFDSFFNLNFYFWMFKIYIIPFLILTLIILKSVYTNFYILFYFLS
jgi:hypothetical protein